MTWTEAAELLADAVKDVPDCRVYPDPAATIAPPGIVIGPPVLEFEGQQGAGPTSASFPVFVVVAVDKYSIEKLAALVPLVAEALDALDDAVVVRADPGVFNAGGSDLPCYSITTEVAL